MPNVVKGSKQNQMVVVPHRPWLKPMLVAAFIGAVSLAAMLGVYIGREDATRDQVATTEENQRLRADLARANSDLSSLRSDIAILDRSRMVDQRATEEAQVTINSLRSRLTQLEQDISFYRQVMAPESDDQGLVIGEAVINAGEAANQFSYQFVFRQQGQQDNVLEGQAEITIRGRHLDENVSYSLAQLATPQLDETLEVSPITLRFRYFQNVEGEIYLPEGFQPELIEIAARSLRPIEKAVSMNFNWIVAGAL